MAKKPSRTHRRRWRCPPLGHMLRQRIPLKIKRMVERGCPLSLGVHEPCSWLPPVVRHYRASRLREILHCEPGFCTSWGGISLHEQMREVLVRARDNVPGVLRYWW